ncbi:hypothetical protein NP233_g2012 [Leucocoprinus birnbaumii]|uniref:DUF866-domain-containing protein n=1 Tax=Leucocoprinus birnbaumii TaxID=56174 RepID=A0AAD5VZS4_9AGAR|nr:hypothetical protein NP233_g2012 [Leucocoprinus birnbaumii]
MVLLKLSISAELENVTELQPASEDFEYHFRVKCSSCNEEHPKTVSMNRKEEHEVSGGKHATAHFVWRFSGKRESSAKFDTAKKVQPYTSENAQPQPLLVIECRGLEFTGFEFLVLQGPWKCVGSNGTVFDDIDLGDGEWTDYDEKAALPVGISTLSSQWSRA